MLLWDHLKRFSVYRKLFLSYSILVAITVTLISAILFERFSHSSIMEINEMSQSVLTQTSYASDVIYDQVFSVGNELLHNNEIITTMHSSQKDALVEYNVIQKLSYIQAVYPFINYISIYNGNLDRYLNNKAISKETDAEVISRIRSNDGTKYYDFIPREIYDDTTSIHSKVLTFILYSNFSQLLPKNGALVINVNESYINRIIQGMTNRSNSTIFVIDHKGTVLSHTDPVFFLKDFSQQDFIRKILHSENGMGYMQENSGSGKQLVTYVKSSPSKLDWIFVSVKPYRLVLSGIYRLLYTTLAIALALILLGVLFSILLASRLYNPLSLLIKRIGFPAGSPSYGADRKRCNEFEMLSEAFSKTMDRANTMEVSLKTSFPVLRETYLSYLLKGNMEKLPDFSMIMKEMDSQLDGKFYCVLVFKIDGYRSFEKSNSSKDKGLLRFAICNIVQELIGSCCTNTAVDMEKDHVAVLARLDSETLPGNFYLLLEEARTVIKQYFDLSVSVGIGDIVASTGEIHCSYTSALQYVGYRLFYGPGCIVDRSRLKDRPERREEYPYKLEKSIIEAIQSGDPRDAEKSIDSFITALAEMTVHSVFVYSNQLLVSVLREFGSVLPLHEVDYTDYYRIVNSFSEIELLEEVASCTRGFCSEILTRLENNRNHKNRELLEYVYEFVQNNYANPNLSLDLVAEQVRFSSGYLGKMFKKATAKSFNDYVTSIRLEKACGLLSATNESSAAIGEKVGILNNTYFFTLFKKVYGTTPTQYRTRLNLNGARE